MAKIIKKFAILLLPMACFSLLTLASGCEKPKEKQDHEHFGPNPGDGTNHAPTADE